jgi:hypothetical protein
LEFPKDPLIIALACIDDPNEIAVGLDLFPFVGVPPNVAASMN